MKTLMVTLLGCALVVTATSADAASPQLAQAAVDKAQLAMEGKRYAEAAESIEEAFRHDPNPLWQANAGYAWMLAGQLDRAIAQISEALGDAKLTGEARTRATERLGSASSARALIGRADDLRARGDLRAAAEACDAALEHVPIGPYYLMAARLYEEAGDLERAAERYQTAVGEGDLSADQQREATEALVRVARAGATPKEPVAPPVTVATPAPEAGPNVAGWTLVGVGALAVGAGVLGFVMSADREAEFDAAVGADGLVAMSRAEAEELESESTTWWVVGVAGVAVGAAALTTGIILLATDDGEPEGRGEVVIGASPILGGGLFTASGRF